MQGTYTKQSNCACEKLKKLNYVHVGNTDLLIQRLAHGQRYKLPGILYTIFQITVRLLHFSSIETRYDRIIQRYILPF